MAIRRPRAPLRLSTARRLPGGVLAPLSSLHNIVVPISDAGGGDGAAATPYVPSPIVARVVNGAAGDNADVAAAFNALAPSLPATTTSSVVFNHLGTTPYLYVGNRGVGVNSAAAADFIALGGASATLRTQTFIATAGQTTFTLAQAPTTPANTELSLRGAPRDFGTDFTVAGTTVTLTMPGVTVFAGDTVIVQHD